MPSPDPNKKMEDLLRAYARHRREEAGPPFELSPGVRARLQQEVRRALGKPAAPPAPRWGLTLTGWLRLALGGAVAALVIVMFRDNPSPSSSSLQFAKSDNKQAARPANAPVSLSLPPAAPAPAHDMAKAPAPPPAPPAPPGPLALDPN